MLLGEPAPTPFDINFQIMGVPVRIHPFFFLGVLIFGGGIDLNTDALIRLAIFGFTLFLAVLGHELGHVMAFGYYGIRSRVVLMLFGGLAIPDSGTGRGIWSNFGGYTNRGNNRGWAQVIISGAGPAANFAMALAIFIAANLAGFIVTPQFDRGLNIWDIQPPDNVAENLVDFVRNMLWLNTILGLFNLLPIYPLDGGQISRELFVMGDPWRGVTNSLWLSCITAGVVAFWMFTRGQPFAAMWFGALGFGAFQQLQGSGGGRRPW